jgi:hypothetical protein
MFYLTTYKMFTINHLYVLRHRFANDLLLCLGTENHLQTGLVHVIHQAKLIALHILGIDDLDSIVLRLIPLPNRLTVMIDFYIRRGSHILKVHARS